ncbi:MULTISPECIES: aromatic ring-hydroxylating oxygenase subunit alpha [unclassified Undibacterium]|uniref:aromatic ring-hydroxylating oxygenase subunit alpha n=1 Tax=unclassified Undibacterium TaxID=2630295 RepID=UPI002AC92F43|nr:MULTISPECIES: Rieske 2Fe-2S domain-containing protein [unclassified Undibacterium]MEB0139369.1 Rieske 2Fe-2S domain-containing protein [Undibacterium sp. CCC2.1]MEB0173366.1 Rieske 2Fe-2S domain-containing protein [Undibacterium sp. CCC1.1]MEB0177247.1 Rieske 2Fe-2S domain-containing protein [Undibacterium sp. CCC3.4]MEB0216512.1 Rieske 2Fe-2S domain-containing protein [Undibacterium sp. 5I2]WPX44058.1 Rieske 2Fe-2S domain-containing protein [Undibacterium sp. CCC3.4]
MISDRRLQREFWHLLCHRSELPEQGQFIKLNWLNEELCIFNDHGDLLVFDNLCPHRGTRFFTEQQGRGRLSCSYHGWSYSQGQLHIPCREKFAAGELDGAHLNTLRTEWCGDFLFAAFAPRSDLDTQLGEVFMQLASISMCIDGAADFNAYPYQCNWKLAIENAQDSLHIPFVHPHTLGRLALEETANVYHGINSLAYFKITDASADKKLRSIKRMFDISEQHEGYMSIYLFPFTMLTSTYGYSYSLQNFFPSEQENKTFFYSRLLKACLKKSYPPAAMAHFFDSSAKVNRQVFEEDHEICKKIAPHFYDVSSTRFLSVEEEKIAHFRKTLQAVDALSATDGSPVTAAAAQ